jgi:hypothetical protein
MGARRSPLIAVAVAVLALDGGCLSPDAKRAEVKKPDVMQPGVLPPPQETTARPGEPLAAGPVVPASASVPAAPVGAAPAKPVAPAGGPSLSRLTAKLETKTPASEFLVGWQQRIAHLPDPAKNGRMSPGWSGRCSCSAGRSRSSSWPTGC